MAEVSFEVRHEFDAPPRAVWDELVAWDRHGEWIPMTRMVVEPGDPTAVGARFTGFTGVGKLALEDRMEVLRCDWFDDTSTGNCEVAKHGPVLTGRAGFTIEPRGAGSALVWTEDVTVPYVPEIAAPIVARLGAAGFRTGMRRLAKLLGEHRATAA